MIHIERPPAGSCYTDIAGRPCGKRAAASIIIVPPGAAPADAITEGRISLCMRHLLVLMYTNGVGTQELADVVDALSLLAARQLADEERERRNNEPRTPRQAEGPTP